MANTFRANLRRLVGKRTWKQVAAEAGVPYQWLRTVASKGLTRTNRTSRPNLKKLAKYLNVEVEDLLYEDKLSESERQRLISLECEFKRLEMRQDFVMHFLVRVFEMTLDTNDLSEVVRRIELIKEEFRQGFYR